MPRRHGRRHASRGLERSLVIVTQALPTVRVRHPDDPDTLMIINAGDLRDGHVLWPEDELVEPSESVAALDATLSHQDDEPNEEAGVEVGAAEDDQPLRVGKGPRGKWYVKRGKDNVAGPFETEGEAGAAVEP